MHKTIVCVRTNITEVHAKYELSRGYLVSSLLLPVQSSPSSDNNQQEIDTLISTDPKFAGFNLLLFTPTSREPLSYDATLLTNNGGGNPLIFRTTTATERHCAALSNGIDQQGGNEWPKVKTGVALLSDLMEKKTDQTDMELAEDLFQLLS